MTSLSVKKILVIQTAFIGDVILITPLINGLKQIYPEAAIDVVVIPQCKALLENNPNVRKIHCLDKHKRGLLRFISAIKSEGYDLSVSPHSSLRSGLIPFLARIPYRIGFKRNLQRFLLTKSIVHAPASEHKHKVVKNLSLFTLLPIESSYNFPMQTTLFPTAENYRKVEGFLDSLPEHKPVVILAPGSVWFTKRWPLHKFLELAEQLVNSGYVVVLTGSAGERELCEHIQSEVNTKYPQKIGAVACVAGEFDLMDSVALIEKVQLVVCNDSGTLHMANAVKTPVFAFFGPTTQDIGYFPFGDEDLVFEVELPCRPCGSHGGQRCPKGHHNCMEMINVDDVFQKVIEFFNEDNYCTD